MTIVTSTTTTDQAPVDGAALYMRCLWEEARETGQSVDWRAADEVLEAAQQDALYVDECQGGYSDWRRA